MFKINNHYIQIMNHIPMVFLEHAFYTSDEQLSRMKFPPALSPWDESQMNSFTDVRPF